MRLPSDVREASDLLYGISEDFGESAVSQIHRGKARSLGSIEPGLPRSDFRTQWAIVAERQNIPVVYDRDPGIIVAVLDAEHLEVRSKNDVFTAKFVEKCGFEPDIPDLLRQVTKGESLHHGHCPGQPPGVMLHTVHANERDIMVAFDTRSAAFVDVVSRSQLQKIGRPKQCRGGRYANGEFSHSRSSRIKY
jgi:hypothetical protein